MKFQSETENLTSCNHRKIEVKYAYVIILLMALICTIPEYFTLFHNDAMVQMITACSEDAI